MSFAGVLTSQSVVRSTEIAAGWVKVAEGLISEVGDGTPPSGEALVDLGECTCAPGFVDLHVHGGGGSEVNTDSPWETEQAVRRFAQLHAIHGTTALLPTTVSDSPERTLASVRGVAQAVGTTERGARVLGVHLEGPWLSPQRAGAQDPRALRTFEASELDALLAASAGAIEIVTLAPELPGAAAAIGRLTELGIVVSVGHTDADYDVARAAIASGARHFTHLHNAMSGMSHRAPGVVGAALSSTRCSVELIADGHHVHPAVLGVTFRAARRPVLITDAISATGLPDGRYRLGRLAVLLKGGKVTLAADPDTLAGSVLTMEAAVRTAVRDAGVSLFDAVAAASTHPAEVIGRDDLGQIAPGRAADLVILDPDLRVAATMVGGEVVYDRRGLFGSPAAP